MNHRANPSVMGNTSDRVSADRQGSKPQRSDSGGGHKDLEPSKMMMDSTDDPNIFNTHGPESKVCKCSQCHRFSSNVTDELKQQCCCCY